MRPERQQRARASRDAAAWFEAQVIRAGFLRRYPGYASRIASLTIEDDPSVRAMGVSRRAGRLVLGINVRFFEEDGNERFLFGILLHELHHIALGHLDDPRCREAQHPDLMVIAAEISANEPIREPLPERAVSWRDYVAFGIGPGQRTVERYERLVEARERGEGPAAPRGAWMSEHPTDSLSARLAELLAAMSAAESKVRVPVCPGLRLLRSRFPLPGTEPGADGLFRIGAANPSAPPVDWREAIEMFVRDKRASALSYARPNRRFPDRVFLVPGWRRTRIRVRPDLIAAIDTSASMRDGDLARIGLELRRLGEEAKLTIVECDAKIRRVYAFEGELRHVAGRGGTDLRPVFAPGFLREHHPDGIVYFTDGQGRYPDRDPGVKTLWILTGGGAFACPWGEKRSLAAGSNGARA
ncbi:MAG: hypothetical protein JXP34_14270 [Planctomycetes bacterium]|nr:hypothetical protein [Planctomycetota bacterium]